MNKFCINCGKPLDDDSAFCKNCGAQINRPLPPPYQNQAQNYNANKKNYSNLGGWLLAFVIANIIGVMSSFVSVISEVYISLPLIPLVDGNIKTGLIINVFVQMIVLSVIVFNTLLIVQIFQRKSLFLRYMQIARILMMISVIFTLVALNLIGIDKDSIALISNLIGNIIGNIAGIFLMTLYFCKSVRVRTYMRNDDYMKKAIFSYK